MVRIGALAFLLALPHHALADDIEAVKTGEAFGVLERVPTINEMVCSYSWNCSQALAVMSCESTNNPLAYAAGNYGLFQVNRIHAWRVGGNVEALYDPATNIRVAHDIYRERGWAPWAHCGGRFR